MYRLLAVVVLIGVCLVGAAFYFGYLRVGSDSAGGMTHITFTWDRNKLQEDEKNALEKMHNLGHEEAK
jgi:hypothetical protein